MHQPLVSIGMPVFNGEAFLRQAIESLLGQDYPNIELILLDNISTDRTPEICKSYARKDHRVKYILDDRRIDIMQAHKKLAGLVEGEYCMCACDDDMYDPSYISSLLSLMRSNPDIGLAYSNFSYITTDGYLRPSGLRHRYLLDGHNTRMYNFAFYLVHRSPIPFVFGLIKTELHRKSLKYFYRVDNKFWSHDNLYMLRLMSLARVASTPKALFHYRERDRVALYKDRKQLYDPPQERIDRYLCLSRHQSRLTSAVFDIINESDFSRSEKCLLKCFNMLVLWFNISLKYITHTNAYSRLRGV